MEVAALVTVYFTNGNKATLPSATRVEAGEYIADSSVTAIVCYDAQDKVVGQFKSTDISGYDISEAKQPQGERSW